MTLGHLLQSFSTVPAPVFAKRAWRLEWDLLLSHVLNCRREDLYIHYEKELHYSSLRSFQALLKKRMAGVPVAYLTGEKEFYGYKFKVRPGVFIPRPETETLVSAVLSQVDKEQKWNIWDLGCGAGAVGLSLLSRMPKAFLTAVDFNEKALELSRINAKKMAVADRVCFLNKNVFHLREIKQADLVVSNPPYVAFKDPRARALRFEPAEALFSGEKGLRHIKGFLKVAEKLLKPSGAYFFEVGADHDLSFAKEQNMRKTAQFRDLSGIVRVMEFRCRDG